MKTDLLAKLTAHLESPEGQEHLKQYCAKIKADKQRLDERILAFHGKYHDKLDEVLEHLINKYDSDKYRNKEYRLGYEPREDLLWFMLAYAEKYCTQCLDEKYLNDFTGDAYYIGTYVIQVMHGQGSVIKIERIYN